MKPAIFLVFGALCLLPWAEPWMALLTGVVLALAGMTAFAGPSKKLSKILIQVAVVLLGFSTDLRVVMDAGLIGLAFAVGTIVATLIVGFGLGAILGTETKLTALLSTGTAICGGSAIAATGPAIRASDLQMSVALACVFILNSVALLIFPPIGHALGLSQHQFGAWAAVAIHDVSSVVGAARTYGDVALQDATVIKLTRALWIVPVAIAMALIVGAIERRAAARAGAGEAAAPLPLKLATILPWFIVAFVVACVLRTTVPAIAMDRFDWGGGSKLLSIADVLKVIAKALMTLALYLIGAGLSRRAILSVGWRPFVQAVITWVFIGVVALFVVRGTIDGGEGTAAVGQPAAQKLAPGRAAGTEAEFFEDAR